MNLLTRKLALLAASAALATVASGDESRVEILHFWSAPAEQEALEIFRGAAIERGVEWKETVIDGNRDQLQVEFSNLLTIGTPPSVVHWVTDGQLLNLIDRGVFTSIDDPDGKYKALYVPEVYDLIATEGGITSAPVGIHSYNFLIYNKSLLEKYGLEPAPDLETLLSYGEILAEDGIALAPVSDQAWQLRYPMLSTFSVNLTADQFRQLFGEGEDIIDLRDELIQSFQFFIDLRQYAAPDRKDLGWTDAVDMVENGEALVMFMGDFAVPQFDDQDAIICQPTPTSDEMYVGIDSFAFPNVDDSALTEGQKVFLDATTDPELVAQYVNLKGGLPTVKNVDPSQLLPCHARNLERWQTAEKVWTRSENTTQRFAAFAQFLSVNYAKEELSAEAMADDLINLFMSFY